MVTILPFVVPQPEPAGLWPLPTPLPSTLPNVPAFDALLLPADLRAWVVDIAERMQCPLDFVAIPAMVAAGSLIGRQIGIRPESKTDWTEVGNLWGCVVGPPGALKSPAVAEALAPLRRLEAQAAQENQVARAEYERATALYKLHKDAAEQRAKKALKEGDTDIAGLLLAEPVEPEKPAERRYLATDATVEKLGEICADNPMGIFIHRDELLTLFSELDREEKAAARGFFLSGWGGREGYTFDRIMRGTVRIDSVNLSLVGTTQPNRLGRYMQDSFRCHDDGMVQRLQLLCWPDFSGKWQPTDRYPDVTAKSAAFECYSRLARLDPAQLGAERDSFDDGKSIPFLRFDSEALEEFVSWRSNLEVRVRADDLSPHFIAHLAKYRGLIPRLALVYHLASGRTGPVHREACLAALAWGEYLEAHAARAYASLSSIHTDTATRILKKLRKGDLPNGFTEREVKRRCWSGLTDKAKVSEALKLLEEYDWLRSERVETGGRPSVVWYANPETLP
jgi:hypothetical protein